MNQEKKNQWPRLLNHEQARLEQIDFFYIEKATLRKVVILSERISSFRREILLAALA